VFPGADAVELPPIADALDGATSRIELCHHTAEALRVGVVRADEVVGEIALPRIATDIVDGGSDGADGVVLGVQFAVDVDRSSC
jgi:hypothetical protein